MFDELKDLVEKDNMAKRHLEGAISQKRAAEASLSQKQSEAKELLGIPNIVSYQEIKRQETEYYENIVRGVRDARGTQGCDNDFLFLVGGMAVFFLASIFVALLVRPHGGERVTSDTSGHHQYVEYKIGDRVRIVSDGKTIYGQVAAKRCGSVITNTDGYGYGPPNKRQPACVYSIAREGWVRDDGTTHREPTGEMLENITAEKLRRF